MPTSLLFFALFPGFSPASDASLTVVSTLSTPLFIYYACFTSGYWHHHEKLLIVLTVPLTPFAIVWEAIHFTRFVGE